MLNDSKLERYPRGCVCYLLFDRLGRFANAHGLFRFRPYGRGCTGASLVVTTAIDHYCCYRRRRPGVWCAVTPFVDRGKANNSDRGSHLHLPLLALVKLALKLERDCHQRRCRCCSRHHPGRPAMVRDPRENEREAATGCYITVYRQMPKRGPGVRRCLTVFKEMESHDWSPGTCSEYLKSMAIRAGNHCCLMQHG